jgi:hypothetical protein
MRIPWALRPGAGFVLLVLVLASSVAFFAWGMATPPLDEAWRIQVELRVGRTKPLSKRERRIFSRAMCRHAEIADGILDEERAGVISAHHASRARSTRRSPSSRRAIATASSRSTPSRAQAT